MANPKKDADMVSNETHEVKTLAERKNVPLFVVLLAKHVTGSSDRKELEKWIDDHKGQNLDITY